jgi:hypothetical protein
MVHLSRKFLVVILCAFLVGAFGCVRQKAMDIVPPDPPPPRPVHRPIDEDLKKFEDMVRAYTAVEERDITIEIDLVPPEGLDEELPTDVGNYARQAIEDMGKPFTTFRTLPPVALLRAPAGSIIPLVQNDRPKPPAPSFRLVGIVRRATDIVELDRNARVDVLAGEGHHSTDAQAQREHREKVTSLTLEFTLERPDGLAVRGATAAYRVRVERSERNRAVSVYVAGSGFGGGSRLTVTQEFGDALYDAVAASVMHLLGNALLVPYYRCNATFPFPVDRALDERVRDALNRLTRAQLERNLKRFLYLAGFAMDLSGPDLTIADRAVVVLEMQRRSLEFLDRRALVELAFDLWKNLDYPQAAQRIDARLADTYRDLAEAAQREAEAVVGPAEFGWPAEVRMVVLDLSRVPQAEAQEKIPAVVRACVGCDEIRLHTNKPLIGVRMSSLPSELQRALRQSRLPLEYVWTDPRQPRLWLSLKPN